MADPIDDSTATPRRLAHLGDGVGGNSDTDDQDPAAHGDSTPIIPAKLHVALIPNDLDPSVRYELERTWRQVRQGPPA